MIKRPDLERVALENMLNIPEILDADVVVQEEVGALWDPLDVRRWVDVTYTMHQPTDFIEFKFSVTEED